MKRDEPLYRNVELAKRAERRRLAIRRYAGIAALIISTAVFWWLLFGCTVYGYHDHDHRVVPQRPLQTLPPFWLDLHPPTTQSGDVSATVSRAKRGPGVLAGSQPPKDGLPLGSFIPVWIVIIACAGLTWVLIFEPEWITNHWRLGF